MSLLMPYRETEAHSPNWIEPPPDIIEGEPEWEVECYAPGHLAHTFLSFLDQYVLI